MSQPPGPRLPVPLPPHLRGAAAALVALVVVLSPGTAPAPAVASPRAAGVTAAGAWSWPVDGPVEVVRGFEAPATRYSAGHRGVDLAVHGGTPVRAAADGTVSFAGVVVDRPLVSVSHGDGYITTVEPVAAMVATGDHVARGSIIGTLASGGHCLDECLHVGVRLHGEYVSPFSLIGEAVPAVLLPLD